MVYEIPETAAPTKKATAGSIIIETENGDKEFRLKIDGRIVNLPEFTDFEIHLHPSGTGMVYIKVPANQIKVLPAGKRLSNKTSRRRAAAEPKPPAVEGEAAADE
ncbi:hypothetical protein [Corynebacterium sp.]|uniref:hypothetical protein n=1 Tax=Corynebacterium sp. TaxID=1720 RepID=UPI0028AEDB45|nr:hypothetical protein [Corynebacterium sp.]